MSFQSFNKHPQYRSVPHEAVELQPLSDGSGIGGLYNEVAQNETNAALKPTRVAETQLFRLENIGEEQNNDGEKFLSDACNKRSKYL